MAELAVPVAGLLQPFTLGEAAVRGRVVRLGPVADTILRRHAYSPAISALLGEALCVASILAANLKHEGVITLQMKGAGPLRLLVVDALAGKAEAANGLGGQCELRGYAELEEGASPAAGTPLPQLLGEGGYLAITYDPGPGMQRYQGVVALEGDTLAESLAAYFVQSQQLDVQFHLAVGYSGGHWDAAGLMVERVAEQGGGEQAVDAMRIWHDTQAYLATLGSDELLDVSLPVNDLLFRLFHEVGVRVTAPVSLSVGCRCSRSRIHGLLMSMPVHDRADMVVDGRVSVHCQFCDHTEIFTPEEMELSFNQ